jgi:hypothetical protein
MRRWFAIGFVVIAAAVAGVAVALGLLDGPPRDEGGAVAGRGDEVASPTSLPPWTVADGDDPAEGIDRIDDGRWFGVEGAQITDGYDITLYVGPEEMGGGDVEVVDSLSSALARAADLRLGGEGVRILIAPGVYREAIVVGGDEDDAPPLVIESEEPGTAVISGADAWADWTWDETSEAFIHAWPYDWEPAPDVEEIVGRRELVVVDGVVLEQVLRLRDLDEGTFFVDAAADTLYMRPPKGSSFPSLTADVGVRPQIMNLDSARNVTVRGLVFRHTPNSLDGTAVRISNSDNIVFEHNIVTENNWTGLGVSRTTRATLSDNLVNENGGGGASFFQTKDVVFARNDTSLNNWRGVRGEYIGWSIAGVKAVGVSDMVVSDHRAWGNNTRGLWFDYDVANLAILDSSWCHNLTDGLFLEAMQGPVVVNGVEACHNARYGLLMVNLYEATIEESLICGNGVTQIHVDAQPGGRKVETANGVLDMIALKGLSFRSNAVAGDGLLMRFSIPKRDFDVMVDSLDSDGNTWLGSSSERPFELPGGREDLEGWQSATGQDRNSSWDAIGGDFDCGMVGAP